jgi:adenylate kinase
VSHYGDAEQKRMAWPLTEVLAAQQAADGGWKEIPAMEESNAFATGQVLYALKQAGVSIDCVLEIDVPFQAIVERMSGRRAHPGSGRTYHIKFNPPKVDGKDDVTGEPLVQRDDDKEETVLKRLEVYAAQTRPLVDYYSAWSKADPKNAPQVRKIDGMGSVDEITERALQALADC